MPQRAGGINHETDERQDGVLDFSQSGRASSGNGHRQATLLFDTVDADSAALATIQGLSRKTEDRSRRAEDGIQTLEAENAELKRELVELTKLVKAMNQQLNGAAK